jgi:hypothetical protein
VAIGFSSLALTGCGSSASVPSQSDKSLQNLQKIGAAYMQAAVKLGRPPGSVEDLTESLKSLPGNPNPADVLRSPDDNENYVIVWGVNFSALARERGNTDVIIAYEQKGKNGSRHVLMPPAQVYLLTEERFRAASFPPGHTPAE